MYACTVALSIPVFTPPLTLQLFVIGAGLLVFSILAVIVPLTSRVGGTLVPCMVDGVSSIPVYHYTIGTWLRPLAAAITSPRWIVVTG